AIWMSQFLDCFSEPQILAILIQAAGALEENNSLYVLEPFWDCQQFNTGAYSINATSLYFTCLANGVSRMYNSKDIIDIAREAGFGVKAQHDNIGTGHTLLHLVKTPLNL
ncbi:MAG: SAM-dependent methyltransferase, partial [Desulfobulbaceae bacterium]|nr:SAM-dependent methyltransferase [Desulfobulbaceae bacterium]